MVVAAVRQACRTIERLDLGGWSLLVAGLMVLAATLLAPAWEQTAELRRRSQAVEARLARLAQTHRNHCAFVTAVRDGHPLLLQRLAWRELNMVPADARLLRAAYDDGTPPATLSKLWLTARPGVPHARPAPPSRAAESKLIRWTTGRRRPLPLVAGAVLVGLAMCTTLRKGAELAPRPRVA